MGDFWDLIKRITGVYYTGYDTMCVMTADGKEFDCQTPSRYRMLWFTRIPVDTACFLTSRYHPTGGILGLS